MEKTYSQKVARVFEIWGYILLTPTLLSLLIPMEMSFRWMSEKRGDLLLLGLLPFLIVTPGLILMIGYRKHSRGKLAENCVSVLWISTAVYNFLLLLLCLYAAAGILQAPKNYYDQVILGFPAAFYFFLFLIFGYVFAISVSLKANSSENRKKLY